ncbi:MAG: LysR family transcriptional regulator [Gammaproteobacteria bacterium]|nr:LysR family transcriptional regulator [Gammaproteobacteria bacterium]
MASSPSPPYYKQNRLKQLRAFCNAARTESVSEAAERLFLSQPTVSLQIQALEREFETMLFERRGPKIRLTPEGKTLYKLAQPLIQGIDGLHETFIAKCGSLDSGELNIAAGESTILYVLPDIMRAFTSKYPKIRIKLQNVPGRDGMNMIRGDQVDFAVGSMSELADDIFYHPIVSYKTVLITPLDHPLASKEEVTLQDISPHGMILPPHHLSTWRMVDLVFKQHNLNYRVNLEAGGWEVIKKFVEQGMGISIVSDVCLSGDEKLARIPLDQYFPDRGYGVVMRRGKFLSPQSKRFIEMMSPDFFEASDLAEQERAKS